MDKNQQIQRLKKELAKQKRKNERLTRKLNSITSKNNLNIDTSKIKDHGQRITVIKCEQSALYSKRSFVSYITALFKTSAIYETFKSFLLYFRRFRIITTTLRILNYIAVVIHTSAVLVVLSAVFVLLVLPFIIISSIVSFAGALLLSRKNNLRLSEELEGHSVFVFFPSRGAEIETNSFFNQNICSLSCGGRKIIVVSPYFFSSAGIKKSTPYVTVRRESENIYIVRKYYYFSLKRNVLSSFDANTAYIY